MTMLAPTARCSPRLTRSGITTSCPWWSPLSSGCIIMNFLSRAPGWSRPSPSRPHPWSVAGDAHMMNLMPSSSVKSVSLPAREPSSRKLRSRGPSRRHTSMNPSSCAMVNSV
jgi:hypothetical protein